MCRLWHKLFDRLEVGPHLSVVMVSGGASAAANALLSTVLAARASGTDLV